MKWRTILWCLYGSGAAVLPSTRSTSISILKPHSWRFAYRLHLVPPSKWDIENSIEKTAQCILCYNRKAGSQGSQTISEYSFSIFRCKHNFMFFSVHLRGKHSYFMKQWMRTWLARHPASLHYSLNCVITKLIILPFRHKRPLAVGSTMVQFSMENMSQIPHSHRQKNWSEPQTTKPANSLDMIQVKDWAFR